MINLLPQYWKNNLREEEIVKTISILGIVVVAAGFCFIMMLFLVRAFYLTKVAAMDVTVAEKERDAKIFNVESAEKQIIADGKLESKANDFYKSQVRVTELFSKVLGALPPEVSLASFDYSVSNVTIKGFSASRDALISFKDNLEKDSDFKNVTFPPDNWLQAQDIIFSATFDLAISQ